MQCGQTDPRGGQRQSFFRGLLFSDLEEGFHEIGGRGKMMVEFFSVAISVSVWR